LPSGYTFSYRVGAIRTGGSATFVRIRQVGNRAQYVVVAASTTPNLPIMISGNSGNITTPTWTAVSVSAYVPPTASVISVVAHISGNQEKMMAAPNNQYGAYDSESNPPPISWSIDAAALVLSTRVDFVLETTDVYYAGSSNGGVLACAGWVDAVNAN
jgi:hypothetical protein